MSMQGRKLFTDVRLEFQIKVQSLVIFIKNGNILPTISRMKFQRRRESNIKRFFNEQKCQSAIKKIALKNRETSGSMIRLFGQKRAKVV